ncbi:MAG: hypothetical protein J2P33_21505, partial [Actinobacteria bacterium]|nr:hypothetical protein [Actinomycetota bacterium]
GPGLGPDGPVAGVTVACAAGAGMMWGPAVARAAADVALTGASAIVDTAQLGLDRFDEAGRSRLAADPVALPFPATAPGGATGEAPGGASGEAPGGAPGEARSQARGGLTIS